MGISVALYLPNFAVGGAERLNINLAPELQRRGFNVSFVVHQKEGGLLPDVPTNIRITSLEAKRTIAALWPLVKYLRREKPDIIISSLGHNNIMALWARMLAGSSTRVIVSQHNSLAHESKSKKWQYKILIWLYRLFLGWANGVVGVSAGVADQLVAIMGIARDRVTVIYNPVITPDFEERQQATVSHAWLKDDSPPVVLGVGRLSAQKDFKTLLDAFALVLKQRDARLIILGEGELRESLIEQAKRLNIADKVDFAGFVINPLPFMRKAKVFVLSSRYEGFGNVLAESLGCGTPVVSTDCPCGPDEILDNGRYGRLVPVGNALAMTTAILDTLKEAPDCDFLKARGQIFSVERAGSLYEHLIYSLHFGHEPFTEGMNHEY